MWTEEFQSKEKPVMHKKAIQSTDGDVAWNSICLYNWIEFPLNL